MSSNRTEKIVLGLIMSVLLGGLFFFAYGAVHHYEADADSDVVCQNELLDVFDVSYKGGTDTNEYYFDLHCCDEQYIANVQSRIVSSYHSSTLLFKYQKTQKIEIVEKSNLLSSIITRFNRQLYLDGLCNASFFSPKEYLSRLRILII